MPAVSLTDYASEQAEIARRQRLADLLTQQGQGDIPIQSYNGIQAAVPWTAVLAKALNSAAGAFVEHRNSVRSDELRQRVASDWEKANGAVPAPAPEGPVPAVRNDDYAAMAAMPQAPPSQGPSGPNPQAMAAALSASAPPGTQVAPPMQPAPEAPAMPPQPAPQGPAPIAAPPPAPDPIQARLAAATANLQKAQQLEAQFRGTPYASMASERVKAAQEQVQKIGDLQDTAASKEAERVAQVARTVTFVKSAASIPPEYKEALIAGAQVDPDLAKEVMQATIKDAFTKKFVPAGPEDLAGYPPGTVAQKDPKTGKLENVYNPVPNLMAVANEKLHAQEVALSGARLGLERQRFAFDKEQKANAVLDPATIQQMAMQARRGDKSVFQNLGRGTQGAQNIVALRRAIFDPALGPMTGAQMAQMNANFVGVTAEQRAIGSRVGQASVGASEVPMLAQQANDAYSKLSRTDLVPFNQLKRMVESGTSNPAQKAAFVADNAAVIARARALSPNGIPHLADIKAGEGMLNDAVGPAAHAAVLHQFVLEAGAMKSGAQAAMGGATPAPAPAPAAGHTLRYNPATGRVE